MRRGLVVALPFLVLAGVAHAQQGTRIVEIPTLPTEAVCAEDKTRLIERALDASRAASENAQIATRAMIERQADLAARRGDQAAVDGARAERERRNEELRRAEAAFDGANR